MFRHLRHRFLRHLQQTTPMEDLRLISLMMLAMLKVKTTRPSRGDLNKINKINKTDVLEPVLHHKLPPHLLRTCRVHNEARARPRRVACICGMPPPLAPRTLSQWPGPTRSRSHPSVAPPSPRATRGPPARRGPPRSDSLSPDCESVTSVTVARCSHCSVDGHAARSHAPRAPSRSRSPVFLRSLLQQQPPGGTVALGAHRPSGAPASATGSRLCCRLFL